MAANWKMYKTVAEAESFLKDFAPKLTGPLDCDVALCPSFVLLPAVKAAIGGAPIALGAQNLSDQKEGAFTGEVSGAMLKSVGCDYVIIGHSERRQYNGETDAIVNRKIVAAFQNGLVPIVCVGETLGEREANKTLDVVNRQVKGALEGLPSAETKRLVIAYEPVWAIGTGKTASPAQAQEVHLAIRDILKDQYGSQTSLVVRILYGGSVKPDNVAELMGCPDIDGGLVGGASLKPDSFLEIVNFRSKQAAPR
jgi:triosephosphate isomerase